MRTIQDFRKTRMKGKPLSLGRSEVHSRSLASSWGPRLHYNWLDNLWELLKVLKDVAASTVMHLRTFGSVSRQTLFDVYSCDNSQNEWWKTSLNFAPQATAKSHNDLILYLWREASVFLIESRLILDCSSWRTEIGIYSFCIYLVFNSE